ncbi:MAG: transcriptional repressor NrdR [Clostridia bacterium]|nr:transcriptional repressor NrdR [Clostridia bacterium]
MRCPYCSYYESKVIDSRPTDESVSIRRRRECLKCGKRFTTYETVERIPLMVIKKNKSREAFDKQKLLTGLLHACQKRPISISTLEGIANDIEAELYNSMEKEVTSKQIGELVMERLKEIDDVAYVRFASVYKEFKDIDTFMRELLNILNSKK